MAIESDSVLVQDTDLIATTLDDEVVLLSVRAGAYFGFDEIGSEIWKLIETPRRVSDICLELSRSFDGDPETMNNDVVNFLEGLLRRGIVRLAGDGPPPP